MTAVLRSGVASFGEVWFQQHHHPPCWSQLTSCMRWMIVLFHQQILFFSDGFCIIPRWQCLNFKGSNCERAWDHLLTSTGSKGIQTLTPLRVLGKCWEDFTRHWNSSIINTRWWLDLVWQLESYEAPEWNSGTNRTGKLTVFFVSN